MAVYDVLPTTNLKYDDIRDTLNAGDGSVNNDVSSAFKESANINMWSKHKPVRLAVNFCQDFDSSKPNYNADWWKGTIKNCGISPNRIISYINLPDLYENDWANDELNGWKYQMPTGEEGSPYRLGDFAGYFPAAVPPFRKFIVPEVVALDQSTFRTDALIPISSEHQLRLSDIGEIENCYFGVYMVKEGSTLAQRATSNSVDNPSIEFNTNGFSIGIYTAYPFLSSVKYAQRDVEKAGDYYSIPQLKPVKFQIVSTLTTISIMANINSDNRSISYTVDVHNNTGGTIKLTNNYVTLRYADKEWLDPLVVGEQQKKLDDFTVGVGTTRVVEGTFTFVDRDLINNSKVWVSLSSSKYLSSVEPRKPITPIS